MPYRGFEFSCKTQFIFTEDAEQALKKQLLCLKPHKLFVVASQSRFRLISGVLKELGCPYVLQTGCMPNPTSEFVDACAGRIAAECCDFVLGVGGGSVIDAVKAAALLAANPSSGGIWDYVSLQRTPSEPALPIGLVVTVPSTGSESNPSAVITSLQTKEKLIYTHDSLYPVFSISSPQLTYTLPKETAASGVADILSHLLEQYLHGDTGVEVSDNMLLGVMKAVVQWGPVSLAHPDCYDAKANLLWASYLAMSRVLAVGHSENWISHMVEHALSARFALAHGTGMALLMPAYMDMIAGTDNCERLTRLSSQVFGQENVPAAQLLRTFFSALDLPSSLSGAGIFLSDAELEACARSALPFGPIEVEGLPEFSVEQARELLHRVR